MVSLCGGYHFDNQFPDAGQLIIAYYFVFYWPEIGGFKAKLVEATATAYFCNCLMVRANDAFWARAKLAKQTNKQTNRRKHTDPPG